MHLQVIRSNGFDFGVLEMILNKNGWVESYNKDVAIDAKSNRSICFSCGSKIAKHYLTKEEKNFLVYQIILHFDFYNDHNEENFAIQKTIFNSVNFLLVTIVN